MKKKAGRKHALRRHIDAEAAALASAAGAGRLK